MNLTLTRSPADGKSVRGTLSPLGVATFENLNYLIRVSFFTGDTIPAQKTFPAPKEFRSLPAIPSPPKRVGIYIELTPKPSASSSLSFYSLYPFPLRSYLRSYLRSFFLHN